VRDIFGRERRPIANTDVALPLARPTCGDGPAGRRAPSAPHRRWGGARRRDYGNKMAFPPSTDAILYHPGYTANPARLLRLLDCCRAAPIPRSLGGRPHRGDRRAHRARRAARGHLLQHGDDQATARSPAAPCKSATDPREAGIGGGAARRDERLYHCHHRLRGRRPLVGGGGDGRNLGARVRLDSVPLKYPGLRSWEIWLRAQARADGVGCAVQNWARLQAICAGQDVEARQSAEFAAGWAIAPVLRRAPGGQPGHGFPARRHPAAAPGGDLAAAGEGDGARRPNRAV